MSSTSIRISKGMDRAVVTIAVAGGCTVESSIELIEFDAWLLVRNNDPFFYFFVIIRNNVLAFILYLISINLNPLLL